VGLDPWVLWVLCTAPPDPRSRAAGGTPHQPAINLTRSTPDYATPVDQQFQVEYDPAQARGNEESESRSPAQSPVRFSKRPRHVTGEDRRCRPWCFAPARARSAAV
jgi:hypothetical protein